MSGTSGTAPKDNNRITFTRYMRNVRRQTEIAFFAILLREASLRRYITTGGRMVTASDINFGHYYNQLRLHIVSEPETRQYQHIVRLVNLIFAGQERQ